MEKVRTVWYKTPRIIRRILVIIAGTTILIAGIAMLVLPGPGWAAIFLALAVYSTEFTWAERLRKRLITRFKSALTAVKAKSKK